MVVEDADSYNCFWHMPFRKSARIEIINQSEKTGIDKVLNAAAMTYVAAAISTLMTLLYFLLRAGLLGGRR